MQNAEKPAKINGKVRKMIPSQLIAHHHCKCLHVNYFFWGKMSPKFGTQVLDVDHHKPQAAEKKPTNNTRVASALPQSTKLSLLICTLIVVYLGTAHNTRPLVAIAFD